MKKQERKYYDILTTEGSTEATILLYGYIGEAYDYYTGEKEGTTDIDFVQELERLSEKYNKIHVRINSPGGEIFHGSAIVTAIRNCKAEVNTWIDGVAASMAGVIWMAGAKRHMAKNGMLMIHAASGLCWGNAQDMLEMHTVLTAFDGCLVTACADATGMSEEDMKKKYYDGKDHWLTYNDVSAEGWLSAADNDDYHATDKLPEDITKMSYRDLVAYFKKEKHPQQPGFLQKVRAFFEETAALFGGDTIQSPINTLDMNLEDFKKSIQEKTLDIEAVKAYLAEQQPPATPPAAPAAEPAPNPELETLKAEVAKLTEMVAAFGKQPGAGKSSPGMPDGDLPTADGKATLEARLKAANAAYESAAAANEQVTFSIGG